MNDSGYANELRASGEGGGAKGRVEGGAGGGGKGVGPRWQFVGEWHTETVLMNNWNEKQKTVKRHSRHFSLNHSRFVPHHVRCWFFFAIVISLRHPSKWFFLKPKWGPITRRRETVTIKRNLSKNQIGHDETWRSFRDGEKKNDIELSANKNSVTITKNQSMGPRPVTPCSSRLSNERGFFKKMKIVNSADRYTPDRIQA